MRYLTFVILILLDAVWAVVSYNLGKYGLAILMACAASFILGLLAAMFMNDYCHSKK